MYVVTIEPQTKTTPNRAVISLQTTNKKKKNKKTRNYLRIFLYFKTESIFLNINIELR